MIFKQTDMKPTMGHTTLFG